MSNSRENRRQAMEPALPSLPKKKTEFPIAERIRYVEEFMARRKSGEKLSHNSFANEKGVMSREQVLNWCRDYQSLKSALFQGKMRVGHLKYPQLEEKMQSWMDGLPTTPLRKDIRIKAFEFSFELGIDFQGSDNWIDAFRKRYKARVAPGTEQHEEIVTMQTEGTETREVKRSRETQTEEETKRSKTTQTDTEMPNEMLIETIARMDEKQIKKMLARAALHQLTCGVAWE